MKATLNKKKHELYRALLALRTQRECEEFLRDLMTSAEIKDFAERWYVVRCLEKGFSYRHINKLTGLSLTTITRVAKWYKRGTGGYRNILKRLQQQRRR